MTYTHTHTHAHTYRRVQPRDSYVRGYWTGAPPFPIGGGSWGCARSVSLSLESTIIFGNTRSTRSNRTIVAVPVQRGYVVLQRSDFAHMRKANANVDIRVTRRSVQSRQRAFWRTTAYELRTSAFLFQYYINMPNLKGYCQYTSHTRIHTHMLLSTYPPYTHAYPYY